MIEVLFFITLFNFGVGVGIWSKAKWDRLHPKAIEPQEKPKEVTDYTIKHALDSWVKTVEDGWKLMFPPHENTCPCVQCEIQFGPIQERIKEQTVRSYGSLEAAGVEEVDGKLVGKGQPHSYTPQYVESLRDDLQATKNRLQIERAGRLAAIDRAKELEEKLTHQEVTNTLVQKRVEVHNEEGWMERV